MEDGGGDERERYAKKGSSTPLNRGRQNRSMMMSNRSLGSLRGDPLDGNRHHRTASGEVKPLKRNQNGRWSGELLE